MAVALVLLGTWVAADRPTPVRRREHGRRGRDLRAAVRRDRLGHERDRHTAVDTVDHRHAGEQRDLSASDPCLVERFATAPRHSAMASSYGVARLLQLRTVGLETVHARRGHADPVAGRPAGLIVGGALFGPETEEVRFAT